MSELRKVEFPGAAGVMLAARLDLPAEPRAFALFAHCFTCGKDIYAASRIAGGLAARNIAVLRFDFTGIGSSEGEFANTNFSSNVGDLVAAADYLRQNHGALSLLIGHSLGGAAVLAAAPRVPDAAAVVTIGAPASAAHVTHNFAANLEEIVEKGTAEVPLAGRTSPSRSSSSTTSGRRISWTTWRRCGWLSWRVMRRRTNTLASRMLARSSPPPGIPKSFLSLDTADHLLRKRADGIYVAEVIATWASRYLPVGRLASALPDGVAN